MKTTKKMIPLFKVFMSPTAKYEVGKVLDSGYIGQGPKVEQFERELQQYFGHDKILTLNSGTSALHLAIHLLKRKQSYLKDEFNGVAFTTNKWPGLEPDDEVLATSLTCTASNFPILANGLKIKWVDIDPKTLNMDLGDLARKITKKTKIIMGVHWGGYPLDLDKIKKIQEEAENRVGFRPRLIEDGAHAFGTTYKGRQMGASGNIFMNSLQAIKHITSVDGGLLHLPTNELYERAKLARWYGIDRSPKGRSDFRCEANITEWGFKFHMNDVNATVGIENLKFADDIISKHKNNAKYYDEHLKNTKGVTLLEREPGFDSSFWIYSILVDNRPAFYEHMKKCNIMVSQVHERNDKHTCVSEYKTELPNLDKTIGKVVNIPVGWWITREECEYIINFI